MWVGVYVLNIVPIKWSDDGLFLVMQYVFFVCMYNAIIHFSPLILDHGFFIEITCKWQYFDYNQKFGFILRQRCIENKYQC